jgi:hypothetical protein
LNSGQFQSEPADQARKLTAHGICPNGDGAKLEVILVWFLPSDEEVVNNGHIEFCEPGDFVRFVGNVWRIEGDIATVCVVYVDVTCKKKI